MDKRIGFIGAGNMGAALLRGVAGSGLVSPDKIKIFDVDREKTSKLKKETGINVSTGNNELVENSDIIILAVKPNYVKSVLEECRNSFSSDKILVSIAVGVSLQTLHDIMGESVKIVRTMPNIPVVVGEGMTLISFDRNIEEKEKSQVKKIFECSGKAEELEEKLMSEVTALTGSSPAYVFMFIEAMADAAVLSGIPRGIAYKLASQAVLGSAKMVMESGKHPGELKDQVCSPAGTTIEALVALEKNGFRYAVMDAMNECTKKAREIGRLTGDKSGK
jgi:pyrroline-5-carboxylate reductase